MRNPVAHDDADGFGGVDPGFAERDVEVFAIGGHVIAGVPRALELDERLCTVPGEAASQVFREGLGAFGHRLSS